MVDRVDWEMQEEMNIPVVPRTYLSRFWILFVSSILCWMQTVLWSTWGPIAESMDAAFTGWGPSTVAMMLNWGTIMFVIWFIPMAWATQRYGLRVAMVASAFLVALSSTIKVFTKVTPAFTIICHLSSILLGIASPLILSTPMMIATSWFPLHERTTAFAVMMGAGQLGCLGSYLEPLLVRLPGPTVSQEDIQNDVMRLMYIEAAMSGILLVAILAYFPSMPPSPPSVTSTSERIEFIPSFRLLAKRKQFMLMLVSYGVFVGPPLVWITILNYSLQPLGFHQVVQVFTTWLCTINTYECCNSDGNFAHLSEATASNPVLLRQAQNQTMWVGVVSVLASSVSPVISGRLNDLFQGHIKLLLILLMMTTSLCFYWFLLITYGIIPLSTWQIYVSVVVAVSCNYASIPLFYEVGVDLAYPVPEILVSSIVTAADNLTSILFLIVLSVHNVGYLWITYTLTLTSCFTILPLFFVRFNYTRANLDTT